jgi:HPt (histidine-containing phosphotransfer) domain-containing protein
VQSIQDALAANDRATAERLAHTLKGVAASVGAAYLAETASLLERAINAGNAEEYPQLIEAATSKLDQAVAAVKTYLKEHRPND